jgi:predicted transcriptional regulator
MPQSILEIAKDLTLTLVEAGRLSTDDMQDTLQKTHATLTVLKAQEERGSGAVKTQEPVDWRKSITRHAITCLECGAQFRQLNGRHLREHGLGARSYRHKYGIPRTQPLAAKTTTARRRKVTQEVRPWEKAPAYVKAQERDGNTAPTPGAEAPKRKRTPPTHQRKAARKKSSEG